MTDKEIIHQNWLKNIVKRGDKVMISKNIRRETDYAQIWNNRMAEDSGVKGVVTEMMLHNNVTVVKVRTKRRSMWYSFNHVVKI